jgi:dsDNA-binding SOS-regulon protein
MIKIVKRFECSNGQVFETMDEALTYEKKLKLIDYLSKYDFDDKISEGYPDYVDLNLVALFLMEHIENIQKILDTNHYE